MPDVLPLAQLDAGGDAAHRVNPFEEIDRAAGSEIGADNPFVQIDRDAGISPEPGTSSAVGAFTSHAARGVLPTAGGMVGAGLGAETGAELGAAIGSFGGPIGAGAGGIVGGLAGGIGGFFAGSAATEGVQDYALKQAPDNWQETLGQSSRIQRLQEAQHPYASFIGGIAPYAVTMTPGAFTTKAAGLAENATSFERLMANPVTARIFGGAAMGGMELGQEEWDGQTPDWAKIGISTGFGVVFNKPTAFGEYLTGLGARPVVRFLRPQDIPATGALNPNEPTVAQAQDLGVIGPGSTEHTFRGGEEQSLATKTTAQNAAADEQATLGAIPPPDLDAIARRLEPDLFKQNDQLVAQRDSLRSWIQDQSNPTEDMFDDVAARRYAAEEALRNANPNSPAAKGFRAQLADIATQETDLVARREAWEGGTHVDTPEILLARQHLLDTEHALWDLGPEISAARRRAADHAGEIEEVPVEAGTIPAPPAETPGTAVPVPEPTAPQTPAPKSVEAQRAFITADRTAQLMAAGLSRQVAEASAHVEAAYYETLAARFQGALGTAEELYRQRSARVVGPNGASPESTPPITRPVPTPIPVPSVADIQVRDQVSATVARATQAREQGGVAVAERPQTEAQNVNTDEKPRIRTGGDIAKEEGIKDPKAIRAIQDQEMLALVDWQARHRAVNLRPKRNPEMDRLSASVGLPKVEAPVAETLSAIVDRLPEERVVEEINAEAEAGEIEYREAEKDAAQVSPEMVENPDQFYGDSQSRSLEELESEHRPPAETVAAEQRPGGGGEPAIAAANQGEVPEGGGPPGAEPGVGGRAGPEEPATPATEPTAEPVIPAAAEPGGATSPGGNEQGVTAGAEPAGVAHLIPTPDNPNVPAHTSASGNGGLESLDPAEIHVDPERFQFKAGTDERGVSERLQGVETWDPRLAGTALVFRDAEGKNWIADGHQRLGLAQRLSEGQPGIRLNAFVLDAKDGITDAQARVIAAAKNIAEGTGTAIDAAKVVREAEAAGIDVPPLPPRSGLVREGRALARLSPDAFGMAVNDVIPTAQAAIVGRLVADPLRQMEAMRVLAKAKPDNLRQAELIVRDVMETSTEATQGGLFGEEHFAASATLERAKVADEAMRQLSRDRTTFRTLVDEAERIEGHGENVLDVAANQTRLTADEQARQLLTQLATRKGPVSEALTGIARRVRDGDISAAAGAREFLGIVRGGLSKSVDEGSDTGRALLGTAREPEVKLPDAQDDEARDLLGQLIPEPVARREPEPTIRSDERQITIPGTGPSAVQAQAARDQAGRGALRVEVEQHRADEGLFARSEPAQPELLTVADARLSGLPNGAAFIEGKGPLGRGRWGIALPDKPRDAIGGYHATAEEAAANAKQVVANRSAADIERVRRAEIDRNLAARLRAGEQPTDSDLRHLDFRPGKTSRFDYLSPVVQQLFGISRAKVREAMGDALSEHFSDMGASTWWGSPRKALMNAAKYAEERDISPPSAPVVGRPEEPGGELFQRGPTWEELLERGRQTRTLAQNYAEAAKPAAFLDRHGLKYLVSKDLNYPPDGWRVTIFNKEGEPTGHWEAKNAYEAFREVLASRPEPIGANHELSGEFDQPIDAYHGTPHEFDFFDTGKIGTGEGAQAYGHGLYFAENPGVAESYRNKLSDDPRDALNDYLAGVKNFRESIRRDTLADEIRLGLSRHENLGMRKLSRDPAAIEDIVTIIDGTHPDGTYGPRAVAAFSRLDRKLGEAPKGNLYAVRIHAEPEQMLDWDKPLSEQSDFVQRALTPEGLGLKAAGPFGDKGYYGWVDKDGKRVGPLRTKEPPDYVFDPRELGSSIAKGAGDWKPEQAAEAMRTAGIKGIRYADAQSRGAAGGTHNVVVFDHNDVEITHRNGEAVARHTMTTSEADAMQDAQTRAGEASLLQQLNQSIQGKIRISSNPAVRSIITLARTADASTFMHETAHDWLKQLLRDALHALAPNQLKADAATVRNWLRRPSDWTGFKRDGSPDVGPQERFARAFEQYLREGHAPSRPLDSVFQKFGNWLKTIYRTLRGLGAPISDDIKQVFDRMLAIEPQRKTAGEVQERPPSLGAIHEADANETHPREADAVADRIASERGRAVAAPPPEIAHEVAGIQEPGGTAQPGAEAGPGGAGPGEVEGRGGQSGPVAPGGGMGTGPGTVGGSRSEATPKGPGVAERAGQSNPPGGRRSPGTNPATPVEQFVPRPAESLGNTESKLVDLAGNIRVENLTDVESIAAAIHDSAERNDEFKAVRGGMTKGRMSDLADGLGLDPASINEIVLTRLLGGTDNLGAKILAARRLAVQSAEIVSGLMKTASETGSDQDLGALATAIARHDVIQSALSGVTAEWGRAGNAFHSLLAGWGKAQDLNQLLKDNLGRDLYQLKIIAKMGARLDTPGKISKFLRDAKNRSFGGMLLEYWINGLISGLATHATYTVGNTILNIEKAGPETAMAAMIGAIRARGGREGTRVRMGEVGAQFRAAVREAPATMQAAIEALRTGATTQLPGEAARPVMPFQGDTSLTMGRGMTNSPVTWHEAIGDAYAAIQGLRDGLVATGQLVSAGGVSGAPLIGAEFSPLGQIPNIQVRGATVLPIGTMARLPSRMIATIHSGFRAMGYSMEINALAYRQASDEGLLGAAHTARTAALRQDPSEEMMALARRPANDLALMGQAGKFTQALQRLTSTTFNIPGLGETALLKFIDPFVHIAGNIMNQSLWQRTPIGLLGTEIRADLMGKNGNIAQDTAMAKMLVGTALGATFAGLAAQGLASGSGPADRNKYAMWTLAGNQAHSIRIGDVWYAMNRLGPMGMLVSVSADLYDVAHQIGKEDADVVGKSLMHAFTQNILDESWMRGPADLLQAVTDPDRYGAGYVRNFATSFLPYSVGMAQMARASDPWSRRTRTLMDAVRAKVPGLSESLFPRRDIWGEPMPSGDALIAPGITAIYERRMSADPVNQAMLGLSIFPAPVERRIRNVPLTDEQYDYYALNAGGAAKMRLDQFVRSPEWSAMTNEGRHYWVVETMKQARESAAGKVMMRWPEIARQGALLARSRLTGEPVPSLH